MNTYCIQVLGQMDLEELNALSPHQMTLVCVEASTTLFTIHTDQAGMIGLLRHLHNLGIVIVSVAMQLESISTVAKKEDE